MDFDRYTDSYLDTLEESVAFAGGDAARYLSAKARLLVDLVRRRLGDPRETKVLDVGCGPGEIDAFLEGEFAAVHGVDLSEPMVQRAAEKNPWAGYSSFREGDPLPFEDEAFDLSFAINVFHHVPLGSRPALLTEMTRVVRRDGLVAIFEHNPWNPLTRKVVHDCPFDEDAVLLPRRESRRLLAGANLAEVECPFIIFFPRQGPRLDRWERRLGRLPLGAQYYVAGRRNA